MAGWIDSQEAAILNHFLRAAAWTLPAALHVALSTTTPTDAGANFTEPVGNGYARESKTRDTTEWAAATGTAPTVGDNATEVDFGAASGGSWGTITHFGFYDAATAGNLLWWAPLDAAKTVGDGDSAKFAVGALDVKLGDPGDAF